MKILPALLLFLTTSVAQAQIMYVQSEAALRESPEVVAKSVKMLSRGTEVEVIKTSGTWLQVKHDGRTGWCLSVFLTGEQPLEQKDFAPGISKVGRRKISALADSSVSDIPRDRRGKYPLGEESTEPTDGDNDGAEPLEE